MNIPENSVLLKPEKIRGGLLSRSTLDILQNPVQFLETLARNQGPVVKLNFAGKKYVIFQHPDLFKHVLLDDYKLYTKPGHKLLRLFLGKGLATSNGEAWLRQRRTMQPAFHRQKLAKMMDFINEETDVFLERLKKYPDYSVINITKELQQFTIALISRTMFNDPLVGEVDKMIKALEDLAVFATSWMKSLVKIPTHWPTPANFRYKRNCETFDDIIYGIIDRRKQEMAGQESIQHDDLLNLLLNYFDEESGAPISRELLRDEVTTMFMAGHETTAQTLSWMLYQLALNKDVNIKVREEGIEVIGNRLPDYEDISKLKYTRQVVHETLRCYPAFYALARKALGNDNLLGIHIGPGTNVLLNLYGLHRHPAFWKNPDRFDPTHFDPEVDAKRQPYVFLPFGGGPRLCLGSNFAMMVMQVVISRMASQFSFDVPDGFIPEIEPNISLRAKGGIWLHIRKVQN